MGVKGEIALVNTLVFKAQIEDLRLKCGVIEKNPKTRVQEVLCFLSGKRGPSAEFNEWIFKVGVAIFNGLTWSKVFGIMR